MSDLLDRVIRAYGSSSGVAQKASIQLVSTHLGSSDWVSGPGDDGAVVTVDGHHLVVGGEAMFPPFVEADPRGAGFGAVLANVNDLAAMGAVPLAIVDTIVGPEPIAEAVFEGIADAAEMYDVPVVGGHLTVRDGPPSVSAFGLGRAERVLSIANVEVGQRILLACALTGTMREDFPFFASFAQRRSEMAGDVRTMAAAAAAGECDAAKDVSMAGMLGSLAMLLEATKSGATIDLDAVPVPPDVAMEHWLISFPAYAFVLTTTGDRVKACQSRFQSRGLTCRDIGRVEPGGRLELAHGDASATIVDFSEGSLTGLNPLPGSTSASSQ